MPPTIKTWRATLDQVIDATRRRLRLASHRRLAWLAVTLIVTGLALGGLDSVSPADARSYTRLLPLELPDRAHHAQFGATGIDPLTGQAPTPEYDPWDEVVVRSGNTLDGIFRQQGFGGDLLHDIMALNGDTRSLKKIRPGDVFGFQRHDDGTMRRMRYPIDEQNYLVIDHTGGELRAERMRRQLIAEVRETQGTIDSSLFMAGKAAGLSDAMVMKLAEIFGWDIDFVLDIRGGDRFYLMYEKIYRDGEFLRDGEILAATFVNQGERFQAVRFEQDGKADFFSPTGAPMRKAFLRAPLNFSYISSNFNPRRFHPILKRVKAHNGIDYRAPKGTPVYAAGDGSVIRSAYSATNGHHVFIKHSGGIETRYLHFTKRTVNQGARVRQGQVIGYVGDTGLATAAHLHYEFLVGGVHRNPRTIPLPQAVPLEGNQLALFQTHAAPLLSQLARQESASLYAVRE